MNAMEGYEQLRLGIETLIGRDIRLPIEDDEFERLALRVFRHQFNNNEPYRRYCERRDRTPDSVQGWSDIPAVPTAAFKEAPLICGDPAEAEIVFRTSGTSQGPERRGQHYVRDLRLYETSALKNFQAHVLPDGARLRMIILALPVGLAPDSSLTWMLEKVRVHFGANGSDYFIDQAGLRLESLLAELAASETGERPLVLLGTAAGFLHLLEALKQRNRLLSLPPGSRLMETGGFKGQGREIPRDEFYEMLGVQLGLSQFYCVAEYGMTEMCSQFYDNVLRERALGRSPEQRYKVVPPWVRTQVVDAESLEELPAGQLGVLRHFDLANLDSVMAIQTDDLGITGADGFEILGRAAGSELRGCSIAMDQWLTAQR